MRTLADGLTGAVMAVEGITDAAVLFHAPGGCRARHMVHSTAVFPRSDVAELFSTPFFYGYPRVPATYLDEYDFINGGSYKLEEAIPIIAERDPGLLVVIDSPGAALIGDDAWGVITSSSLSGKAMHMDCSLSSVPVGRGYDHMLCDVMSFLSPERSHIRKGTVNILGLSIMDKDWMSARDELVDMVCSMGLEVLSVPGAGSSVSELEDSVEAEFSIVVCPEMCEGLCRYYESLGVRTIRSDRGAPVGFDAIESWVRTIADVTGADPSAALARIERARHRIFDKFMGLRYNAVRIRGLTFSVAGMASVIRPLTEWLYSYLAMAPMAVGLDPGSDPCEEERLLSFLREVDYEDSFRKEPMDGSDVVLCEGIEALSMFYSGRCRISIPIGFSSMGVDDIIPRPVYGLNGVLYILDEIMHGVRGT